MTSIFRHVLLLAAATVGSAASAQTAGFEDIARLEGRVIGALGVGIGETGGPVAPIDRRLKLTRCPSPARIDPPALGALALSCPEIGWRIRVPLVRIANSSYATAAPVKALPIIRKGDPVELYVETGGFNVSTEAVAQEDGGVGDRIRVKSDPKSPVLIAEVVENGRVRLPGFK